jgi:hypothetical protein
VCELAYATGISPRELLALDPDTFATLHDVATTHGRGPDADTG